MDAKTPFRRWLRAAGLLLLAAGCQAPGASPVARPQMPSDPLAPIPPSVPGSPVGPTNPLSLAVVPGLPVDPSAPAQAGFTGKPAVAKIPLADGLPQVKVVAVVGERNIITDQEVTEAVRQRKQDYLSLIDGPNGKEIVRDDAKEKAIYVEELRRVIERELILDEMGTRLKKAKKTDVMDQIKEFASKAADRQMRDYKKTFRVQTDDELQTRILTPEGLTLPVIRRQVERQMMAEEYVRSVMKEKGKGVGLAEMRDYYDRHVEEYRTEDRVKWLDIFVSLNRVPNNPRAAYDQALAVQQKAAAGEDFVALAKSLEDGPAVRQNFDGSGEKRGEIRPAELEATVWSLQAGQVSGLVETPTGYHVIKVVEREAAGVKPFDEKTQDDVRKKLLKQLQDREYKRMVEDLWRRGVVKVI